MSHPIPERADVRQLRIQAKELLASLHAGEPQALALATEHDASLEPDQAKLADAQRLVARKHGFPSWPKLVEEIETPVQLERMKDLVESGDAEGLASLLKRKKSLRGRINDPFFGFDSPAIVRASHLANAKHLVPVLLRYGADPNVRTGWWAGGFGALDFATEEVVSMLLDAGARWDVWSAATHGKTDILRELLDKDPELVNAPGGDGERPLHFAKNREIAELLLARGADPNIRDVDHESTPAQYQIRNPEVLQVLIQHGAKPDAFMAAALNDVDILHRVLKDDPQAARARVGKAPYVTNDSEGGHIYAYKLGNGKTPQLAAAEFGSKDVMAALEETSPASSTLVAAAWTNDAKSVKRLLKKHPDLLEHLDPEDTNALAAAAQSGKKETVELLLNAGFDPNVPGMDSGTALHIACWFGYLPIVRLLIGRVSLDLPDAHHGSPPLGWACHGAQWCRNLKGDYPGVVRALLESGADLKASANSGGTPMLAQAGNREDVKAVLKEFGA